MPLFSFAIKDSKGLTFLGVFGLVLCSCLESFLDEGAGGVGGPEDARVIGCGEGIDLGKEATIVEEEQKEAEEGRVDTVGGAEAVRDMQGGVR